jgi:hypothetical protein
MGHKANKNTKTYLERRLLKQSINSSGTAQFIQTNAK